MRQSLKWGIVITILAIISIVTLIKGGYHNLKSYKEKGLISGLISGLIYGLIFGLISVLIFGLITALIFGLIFGIILGLNEEFD